MRLLLILLYVLTLNAQNLKTIVEEVISTNPIILERLQNYNSIRDDIAIAKSGYYPKLDLSIGVGYEDNKKKNQPSLDDTHYNFDVYKNSLTYTQNFFNGFKTTQQVQKKKFQAILAAYSYVEKVNNTTLEVVDLYLKLMKNVELLENEKENIKFNKDILNKVRKLYGAGLTTLSEVNKVEASLALANSNYVSQENTLLDAKYNMHKVLGRYVDIEKLTRPILNTRFSTNIEEVSKLSIQNNPSLLVAKYNIKLAQATYEEKKSSFYPSIDIEISQSINKNVAGVEGTDSEFRAMAYLKYNIFNGFADKSSLKKTVSEISKEIEGENILKRKVVNGLQLSLTSYNKLKEKLVFLKQYKEFSKKTLSLYAKEYTIGHRSLLDLLSVENDFIKSKSQVLDTQYNILFARSRILDTMGVLVSTILKDSATVHETVGLEAIEINHHYPLPISYYVDNNLIPSDEKPQKKLELELDNVNECDEKKTTSVKSLKKDKKIILDKEDIERYESFLFLSKAYRPTKWTMKKIDIIFNKLKSYGFGYMRFEIVSNVYYDGMTKERLSYLAEKRAKAIRDILIKYGADAKNINIILSNDKEFASKETNSSKLLSNRVDIVVYKRKK